MDMVGGYICGGRQCSMLKILLSEIEMVGM